MSHTWEECRPELPPVEDDEYTSELLRTAALRVWDQIPPGDRRSYHSYVCLGRRSAWGKSVVDGFFAAVQAQATLDEERHAGSAKKMLEFMKKVEGKWVRPQTGQIITIMVMRVADSVRVGDDPLPLEAKRRYITACTRCGQNCWLDPLSYGEATPIPVCMRCLNPKFGKLLDEEIARRTGGTP